MPVEKVMNSKNFDKILLTILFNSDSASESVSADKNKCPARRKKERKCENVSA